MSLSQVSEAQINEEEELGTETIEPQFSVTMSQKPQAGMERALAEKDEAIRALRIVNERLLRERALSAVLGEYPLRLKAAEQLTKLWIDELEVADSSGEHVVISRDGTSLEEFVATRLEKPEYQHFRWVVERSGSHGRGGIMASSMSVTIPPRTLGEEIVRNWQLEATPVETTKFGKTRQLGFGKYFTK
jgi:hypothetical protein